jgi:hypothetical protein
VVAQQVKRQAVERNRATGWYVCTQFFAKSLSAPTSRHECPPCTVTVSDKYLQLTT